METILILGSFTAGWWLCYLAEKVIRKKNSRVIRLLETRQKMLEEAIKIKDEKIYYLGQKIQALNNKR